MNETATFENLDRYVIIPLGDDLFSVKDTVTDRWVATAAGREDLSYRDAHDLREEYRWS